MNTQEFSYEFDILWNNIMSNQAPGLSEYEKSVFLTQAQEVIVKGIYNGTLTEPFESTEEARSFLTPLVEEYTFNNALTTGNHIVSNSKLYDLSIINPKPWFIIYEWVEFTNNVNCDNNVGIVKPVTHDTFYDINRNPFKKSNERRVLRLTYHDSKDIAELVSEYSIKTYKLRYIKKPEPIILEDLQNGDTIDGETLEKNCKLNDNLHRVILEMAVKLAQQAWVLTRQTKE